MFTTSTQRKYWTFHEQAELEQLREEVNHQYVSKNGGGDLDADVCVTGCLHAVVVAFLVCYLVLAHPAYLLSGLLYVLLSLISF